MERTIGFYEKVCGDLMLNIEEDGSLMVDGPNGPSPATIGEGQLRLVLPTRHQLDAKEDWSERVAFHPLTESISRQESMVMRNIRRLISVGVGVRVSVLANRLGKLLLERTEENPLKPAQGKLLKNVTNYKKTTHQTLNKILRQADIDEVEKRIINLFVKKGGKVGDVGYSRACIVTFPLLEAVEEDELGIDYRNKTDKEQIMALFEAIMPGWSTEKYNQGTNSTVATGFNALLRAWYSVASQFNKVVKVFAKEDEEIAALAFDLSWYDEIDSFDEFVDEIPDLDGNKGITSKQAESVKRGERSEKDIETKSKWSDIFNPRGQARTDLLNRNRGQKTGWGGGSDRQQQNGWGDTSERNSWGTRGSYVPKAQRMMNKQRRRSNVDDDLPPWVEGDGPSKPSWKRGASF